MKVIPLHRPTPRPSPWTQCHLLGHEWRKTATEGRAVCRRCGKHGYCPLCAETLPKRGQLVACQRHRRAAQQGEEARA
ncbi:MAG: hypothetical protein J2P36_22185 [Ktedonobacteraceae bacterium]|nr:hypothetical protein [Ktedonobacteraceae bacterium]